MTIIGILIVASIVALLLLVLWGCAEQNGSRVFAAALFTLSGLLILATGTARALLFDANTYLGDLWTAFEAVNKTADGYRSSLDYFSPIGPMQQWIYGLTLLVQPAAARSVLLANGMVATASLIFSILLLRLYASKAAIALVVFLAVTTALSPRDIDSLVVQNQSSCLAPYNRWAWSLLIPLVMRASIPLMQRDMLGAVIGGAVIACLLLLKVTYGAVAIGLVLLSTLLWKGRWRDTALTLTIGFAGIFLAELATHGQISGYLNDPPHGRYGFERASGRKGTAAIARAYAVPCDVTCIAGGDDTGIL